MAVLQEEMDALSIHIGVIGELYTVIGNPIPSIPTYAGFLKTSSDKVREPNDLPREENDLFGNLIWHCPY